VLLLTSLADPMDIVRGLECGADNYLTKPYDPEQLLARLRRVLDNHRLRPQTRTSLGMNIAFLGSHFTITSDKEQILDLLLSSVEDVVRTNRALQESQRELAAVHAQLEAYATQKAQEAQLSTEMYRALMQNAGDAIVVLDRDGRIREANARAGELLGRPAAALQGDGVEAYLADDERQRFIAGLAALGHQAPPECGEWRLVGAGGRVVHCEVTVSLTTVLDETLVLGIVRDVTARRKAEASIREGKQRLQALVNAAPLAIMTTDTGFRVTMWNPAAERMFGLAAAEVLGGPIPIVPPERAAEEEAVRALVMAGEATTIFETQRRRADGTLVDVSLAAAPFPDAAGRPRGLIALLTDVSDRKAAELALLRSEEQLRHAQKMEAVGRLAGGVAHDFNNVLTVMAGNAEILLAEMDADGHGREELCEITRAVARARALTQQLLAFSRRQILQPRVLDLNSVVEGTESMLRRLIGEDVRLETRLAAEPPFVRADPGQVEQVIVNLVVNARDALPRGGRIVLEVASTLVHPGQLPADEAAAGRFAVLSVTDNGSGMDGVTLARIFEPFYTTKGLGAGTGLGLATVYGIVEQSGGTIQVESHPGRGSSFRIYLPLVEAEGGREAEAPVAEVAAPRGGSETVLLVEDEPAVRTVTRLSLARHGYHVLEASGGDDALRLVEQHDGPIHLLITDVVMPGMSGTEISGRFHALRPGVPVLYISGYTHEIVSRHGILYEGIELLEKPFRPDVLARKVRQLLDAPKDVLAGVAAG
jgi:PAS domain S-box-containing protein